MCKQVDLAESGMRWRLPHMVDHNRSLSQARGSNSARPQSFGHSDERTAENVADIYNQAGDNYVAYADGDPTQPFAFDGMNGYADGSLWDIMKRELAGLPAFRATKGSFLDAGCGPGSWLRRLVTRALALGFSSITARGFDVA